MDLSVIIPCHNTEPYIQMLLDSLKKQELDNISVEYIFVLDNCSDDTKGRIIRANLDNCRILECCFKSAGLSRNLGFDSSSGDYIWYVDSDDWLLWSNTFSCLINLMKENNLNILRMNWATTPLWPGLVDNPALVGVMWQFIIKRSFLIDNDIRFSNIQPGEDLECVQKILDILTANNLDLPYCDKQMYFYNYGRANSNMEQYQRNKEINVD